jgi:hypothetical protein
MVELAQQKKRHSKPKSQEKLRRSTLLPNGNSARTSFSECENRSDNCEFAGDLPGGCLLFQKNERT